MKHPICCTLIISGGLAACDTTTVSRPIESTDYSALQASCEVSIAGEANVAASEVAATSTIPTNTGTLTTVSLLGAAAPWNCRANEAGTITSIEYSEEG